MFERSWPADSISNVTYNINCYYQAKKSFYDKKLLCFWKHSNHLLSSLSHIFRMTSRCSHKQADNMKDRKLHIYVYILPSEPVIWLYISDTGAHQYSILYGSVKSLPLKDFCPSLCLVFISMCTMYTPLYQFGINVPILNSIH